MSRHPPDYLIISNFIQIHLNFSSSLGYFCIINIKLEITPINEHLDTKAEGEDGVHNAENNGFMKKKLQETMQH